LQTLGTFKRSTMINSKLMATLTRVAQLVVLVGTAATAISCTSADKEHKSTALSATALTLGTTQSFAVLAGSTVTNTGSSVVTGISGSHRVPPLRGFLRGWRVEA
jgi:hypothetical protein